VKSTSDFRGDKRVEINDVII